MGLLLMSAIIVFSACAKEPNNKEISDAQITDKTSSASSISEPISLRQTDLDELETSYEDNGIGDGVVELRKYRMCYYNIPAPFAKLVGRDVSDEWELEYGKTHNVILSDRMLMVDFIKEFDISKEDFERANLELAKFWTRNGDSIFRGPRDYANQEFKEIYNADIIYTFDDEIINAYYLGFDYPYIYDVEFEEAVANGEYTSQTEEWVDVEQMEAEIIAKYGEAELVEESSENVYETETTESAEVQTASEKVND